MFLAGTEPYQPLLAFFCSNVAEQAHDNDRLADLGMVQCFGRFRSGDTHEDTLSCLGLGVGVISARRASQPPK
jgi:hypothetical protein